ncbi:MAG: sigma-54-dependent Fis family transcriptional regulator [Candidatus Eisenbacteria bacterium]|nr:sigma-54-dependent Fis family transcriptional regulator [Candidatus Eisenbacteria bacterium]
MARRADSEARPAVLVVTDDESEGARIRASLAEAGYQCVVVNDREAAVNVIDSTAVDAVVTRLRTPRIAGLQLLTLARARNPEAGGILILDSGEEDAAMRAVERGVVDFETRPVRAERIVLAVNIIASQQRAVAEIGRLNRRLDERYGFAGIVGTTGVTERVISRLKEIAPLDASVLLVGEPGTGKELIAQVIHQNSTRRNGPFVKADCAAFSARLLAQELFGVGERGGRERKRGRFELAAEGTLFLDAIAAAPTDLQARIAEILRTRQLRSSLNEPPIEVDVRLIASSEIDLEGLVEAGQFHEGLHQILNEARVEVPPLRHRRRDVGELARHFLDEFLGDRAARVAIGRDALDRLEAFDWPDNVRELREVMRELSQRVAIGGLSTIGIDDLPEEIRERKARGGELLFRAGTSLEEMERRLIEETLRLTRGNRERAAEMLGMGVRTLYRKIKEGGGGERQGAAAKGTGKRGGAPRSGKGKGRKEDGRKRRGRPSHPD